MSNSCCNQNEYPEAPHPVSLTKNAAERILQVIQEENLIGQKLRIAVSGGGCSGLQYSLDFTDQDAGDMDIEYQNQGVKIVVDNFSAGHLMGTEIDYVDDLSSSGFKFNNPQESIRTCGCGKSFGYKE